jgi:hypothetical protein
MYITHCNISAQPVHSYVLKQVSVSLCCLLDVIHLNKCKYIIFLYSVLQNNYPFCKKLILKMTVNSAVSRNNPPYKLLRNFICNIFKCIRNNTSFFAFKLLSTSVLHKTIASLCIATHSITVVTQKNQKC